MNATAINKITETADTLRRWVTAAENLAEAIAAGEKVALVLETTIGLWQAADYTYKGREIATHAASVLIDSLMSATADRRTKKVVARRNAAHTLFSRLQRIRHEFSLAEKERLGQ